MGGSGIPENPAKAGLKEIAEPLIRKELIKYKLPSRPLLSPPVLQKSIYEVLTDLCRYID